MKSCLKNAVAVFAIVLFLVPFCLSGIAGAEDATLRMLIWEGYAPDDLTAKFVSLVKEKYGVDLKLEITFVNANDDFFPALRDEKTDLFSPSHNTIKDQRWKFIKMRLALPVNLDNVPNYKNILPALQRADYCTVGDDVYGVPHVRGPYGLAYNTTVFSQEPSSWNVFWDPKYKGKYSLGKHAYLHNVSLTALAMGISKDKIWDYPTLNTPELQGKLATLAANSGPMWEGVDDANTLKGQSLAAVWGFSLPELKSLGEPWKIAQPTEGTTGWVDNFLISHTLKDKPKLKRIAEEWLNFTLSDEYQIYDVRGLACAPVTTTVNSVLTPEEVSELHLDDPSHFEKNIILWKVLKKKDRNGIKRLWDGAMAGR
jgi:spermidine/putrescine-binding protein